MGHIPSFVHQLWRMSHIYIYNIYSAELRTEQSVENAFVVAASEERRTEEALAHILHRLIIQAYRKGWRLSLATTAIFSTMWKSKTSRNLHQLLENPPILKKESQNKLLLSLRDRTSSITQDYICYTVSNGQWKIARHLGLCAAVQHLIGSGELVSMLNCFGLCTSHASVNELQTAVCHSNGFCRQ